MSARAVWLIGLVLLASGCAARRPPMTWFDEDRRFTFVDENDAFGGKSDSSYTQGMRFRWDFAVSPISYDSGRVQKTLGYLSLNCVLPPGRLYVREGEDVDAEELAEATRRWCGRRWPTQKCSNLSRSYRPCAFMTVALGQTEYTPSDLLRASRDSTTRPYAGYLFGSLAWTVMHSDHLVTSELTVGAMGPMSAARGTQSLAHWTWSVTAPEPMGWHNQLENAAHITWRNAYAYRLLELCVRTCDGTLGDGRAFDVVPTAEIVVGTLMNRASVGTSVNLGYRYPDLSTPFRIPVTRVRHEGMPATHFWRDIFDLLDAVRQTGWWMVFGGVEARAVAQNAFLSGTVYADGDAGEWRQVKQIETLPFVHELAWGGQLGIGPVTLGYQRVTRSAEYSLNGVNERSHRFGVVTFGIGTMMGPRPR